MFNPSRNEARRFLFDAWRKHGAGELLTALEHIAARVIALHPEFHALLDDAAGNQDRDYAAGELNPFLHLMMHLSISEQLSIDQPAGIRARYHGLVHRLGDEHDAQHAVMDCLAEMIWNSQRYGTPPDGGAYLDCLDKKGRR